MDHRQVTRIFNALFADCCQTLMRGGAAEPLYLPAQAGSPAQLIFREDFAASALHEAAHWCIAGRQRRQQVDFGYAYQPPPRTAKDQARFFELEQKVQTLEMLFAQQAGIGFSPSADNLQAEVSTFAARLEQQRHEVKQWMDTSVDTRAQRFYQALGTADA